MFMLAVGIAVVGLGTLPTLGKLVAWFAAVEAFEDGDPHRFGALFHHVFHSGFLASPRRLQPGTWHLATGQTLLLHSVYMYGSASDVK